MRINEHLGLDEHILWQGRPKFTPFVLGRGIFVSIFGIFFLAFFLLAFALPALSMGAPQMFIVFMIPFFIVPLLMIFSPLIWGFLAFKNTEYLITDKRVIAQTGAIGLDTRFVDLEKIQEVYVKIGFVDRFSDTGSIYAITAGQAFVGMRQSWGSATHMMTRPSISSILEPYKVQRILEEAIQDAKNKKP